MSKFLKMIDKSDDYIVKKSQCFSLPMRLIIIGQTGSGKSGILGNLLLRNDSGFYRDDFEPEDIYVFSGSVDGDNKLETIIEELDIPTSNVFDGYSNCILSEIYDSIKDDFKEAKLFKTKPTHKLIVIDDISFSGELRNNSKGSLFNAVFMNGRKFLISICVTSQKYTDIATGARENASAVILCQSSNKQLQLIESDMNYLKNKKQFLDMVGNHTKEKHDFIIFDFGNGKEYRDKNFKVICNHNELCSCSK